MYVNTASLADKPQVKAFIDYAVDNAEATAKTAQIVPLTAEQLSTAKSDLAKDEAN